VLSNVEKVGAWKTRPIDLWGLLKSFISQLKIGELTKTSLPAEMCYPYSMLEMVAFRQLSLFKALYGINEQDDGLKRMLTVLKYFACLPRNETHNKKPWNPILGETHMARVVDAQNGNTEFMSEQISHHPPVSAFHVRNDQQEFEVSSNLAFTVKFSGNSASISVSGPSTLLVKKRNETYKFSRCIPAMLVRNLVFGTKYIVWEGDCVISCPETGYECKVAFKEGWSRNTVMSGSIYHTSDPKKILYSIDGNCGGNITLNPKSSTVPEKSKFSLVNVAEMVGDCLEYLPENKLEPMSSVVVWGPANAGILVHNMQLADEEKSFVEQEQRRLRAERAEKNETFQGHYFEQKGDVWVLRDGMALSKILSGEISPPSMTAYSARGDHLKRDPSTIASPPEDHEPVATVIGADASSPDVNIQEALERAKHDPNDAERHPPPTPAESPAPSHNGQRNLPASPAPAIDLDSSETPSSSAN
jgi:hypothetical protein